MLTRERIQSLDPGIHGAFTFHLPDEDVLWTNHIMDAGIKKLGRILADVAETNKLLNNISLGDSAATPDDRTLTALVNEHADGKKAVGSFTVNASFPFDLELSTTIPADEYLARPYLAKEIGIWFNTTLFARATDSTGVSIPAGAIPVDYDLVIV